MKILPSIEHFCKREIFLLKSKIKRDGKFVRREIWGCETFGWDFQVKSWKIFTTPVHAAQSEILMKFKKNSRINFFCKLNETMTKSCVIFQKKILFRKKVENWWLGKWTVSWQTISGINRLPNANIIQSATIVPDKPQIDRNRRAWRIDFYFSPLICERFEGSKEISKLQVKSINLYFMKTIGEKALVNETLILN